MQDRSSAPTKSATTLKRMPSATTRRAGTIALGGSSTGLIQNDGDAHGNYMALRLINPSGAGGVFLHWGDTGSQPPVPPERWTLDGRLTFDFRLVQRPTAFGTFRMMELDSNHP